MAFQHPFRPWQIALWLLLSALVGAGIWFSWYPSMSESRLRGLDATQTIARLGIPVYDSRISRQQLLESGTPIAELEPEDEFTLGYYRGMSQFALRFENGRLVKVERSGAK